MPSSKSRAQTALEAYDEHFSQLPPSEAEDMVRPGLLADSSIILRADDRYIFAWLEDGVWVTRTRPTRQAAWHAPMFGWPTPHTILTRSLCRLQTEVAGDLQDRGTEIESDPDPDTPMISPEEAAELFPDLKSLSHGAMLQSAGDDELQMLDTCESAAADEMDELLRPGTPMGDALRDRMTTMLLSTEQRAAA